MSRNDPRHPMRRAPVKDQQLGRQNDTTGSVQPPASEQGHGLTVEFQRVDPDLPSRITHKTRACNEADASYMSLAQLGIHQKMTSPADNLRGGALHARATSFQQQQARAGRLRERTGQGRNAARFLGACQVSYVRALPFKLCVTREGWTSPGPAPPCRPVDAERRLLFRTGELALEL
jgi:hypothetical protein